MTALVGRTTSRELPGLAARRWRFGADQWIEAPAGTPVASALDEVFGALAARAEPDRPAISVSAEPSPRGGLTVSLGGRPAVRVATEGALAPTLEGILVGWTVHGHARAAALHAACLEVNGAVVLLAAGKGSGKSTLALALARAGAKYLGDELCLLAYDDLSPEPFPKAVTLKAGSFGAAPGARTHEDPLRGAVRYCLPPSHATPSMIFTPPRLVVFPHFDAKVEAVSITELSPPECALALVSQTFGGLDRDARMLDLVARLAERPSCLLTYPDAAAAARVIGVLAEGAR